MISKARLKAKAKRLVQGNSVVEISLGLYQVPSSTTKDKVYVIENYMCECIGFKINQVCSHSEAVRLFEKMTNET